MSRAKQFNDFSYGVGLEYNAHSYKQVKDALKTNFDDLNKMAQAYNKMLQVDPDIDLSDLVAQMKSVMTIIGQIKMSDNPFSEFIDKGLLGRVATLETNMQNLQTASAELQTTLKAVSEDIKLIGVAKFPKAFGDIFGKAVDKASDIKALKQQISDVEQQSKKLNSALENLRDPSISTKGVKTSVAQLKNLISEWKKLRGELSQASNEMDKAQITEKLSDLAIQINKGLNYQLANGGKSFTKDQKTEIESFLQSRIKVIENQLLPALDKQKQNLETRLQELQKIQDQYKSQSTAKLLKDVGVKANDSINVDSGQTATINVLPKATVSEWAKVINKTIANVQDQLDPVVLTPTFSKSSKNLEKDLQGNVAAINHSVKVNFDVIDNLGDFEEKIKNIDSSLANAKAQIEKNAKFKLGFEFEDGQKFKDVAYPIINSVKNINSTIKLKNGKSFLTAIAGVKKSAEEKLQNIGANFDNEKITSKIKEIPIDLQIKNKDAIIAETEDLRAKIDERLKVIDVNLRIANMAQFLAQAAILQDTVVEHSQKNTPNNNSNTSISGTTSNIVYLSEAAKKAQEEVNKIKAAMQSLNDEGIRSPMFTKLGVIRPDGKQKSGSKQQISVMLQEYDDLSKKLNSTKAQLREIYGANDQGYAAYAADVKHREELENNLNLILQNQLAYSTQQLDLAKKRLQVELEISSQQGESQSERTVANVEQENQKYIELQQTVQRTKEILDDLNKNGSKSNFFAQLGQWDEKSGKFKKNAEEMRALLAKYQDFHNSNKKKSNFKTEEERQESLKKEYQLRGKIASIVKEQKKHVGETLVERQNELASMQRNVSQITRDTGISEGVDQDNQKYKDLNATIEQTRAILEDLNKNGSKSKYFSKIGQWDSASNGFKKNRSEMEVLIKRYQELHELNKNESNFKSKRAYNASLKEEYKLRGQIGSIVKDQKKYIAELLAKQEQELSAMKKSTVFSTGDTSAQSSVEELTTKVKDLTEKLNQAKQALKSLQDEKFNSPWMQKIGTRDLNGNYIEGSREKISGLLAEYQSLIQYEESLKQVNQNQIMYCEAKIAVLEKEIERQKQLYELQKQQANVESEAMKQATQYYKNTGFSESASKDSASKLVKMVLGNVFGGKAFSIGGSNKSKEDIINGQYYKTINGILEQIGYKLGDLEKKAGIGGYSAKAVSIANGAVVDAQQAKEILLGVGDSIAVTSNKIMDLTAQLQKAKEGLASLKSEGIKSEYTRQLGTFDGSGKLISGSKEVVSNLLAQHDRYLEVEQQLNTIYGNQVAYTQSRVEALGKELNTEQQILDVKTKQEQIQNGQQISKGQQKTNQPMQPANGAQPQTRSSAIVSLDAATLGSLAKDTTLQTINGKIDSLLSQIQQGITISGANIVVQSSSTTVSSTAGAPANVVLNSPTVVTKGGNIPVGDFNTSNVSALLKQLQAFANSKASREGYAQSNIKVTTDRDGKVSGATIGYSNADKSSGIVEYYRMITDHKTKLSEFVHTSTVVTESVEAYQKAMTKAYVAQNKLSSKYEKQLSQLRTSLDPNANKTLAGTKYQDDVQSKINVIAAEINKFDEVVDGERVLFSPQALSDQQKLIEKLLTDAKEFISQSKNKEYAPIAFDSKNIESSKPKYESQLKAFIEQVKRADLYTGDFKTKLDNLQQQLSDAKVGGDLKSFQTNFAIAKSDFSGLRSYDKLYSDLSASVSKIMKHRAIINDPNVGENEKNEVENKLTTEHQIFRNIEKQLRANKELYDHEKELQVIERARVDTNQEIADKIAKQKDAQNKKDSATLDSLYAKQANSLGEIIKLQHELNSASIGENEKDAIRDRIAAQQQLYDAIQKQIEGYGELYNSEKQQEVLHQKRTSVGLDISRASGKQKDSQKSKDISTLNSLYEKQANAISEILKLQAQLKSGTVGTEESAAIQKQIDAQREIYNSIQRQIKGYGELYDKSVQQEIIDKKRQATNLQIEKTTGRQQDRKKESDKKKLDRLYKEQANALAEQLKLEAQLNSGTLGANDYEATKQRVAAQKEIYNTLQKEISAYGSLYDKARQQEVLDKKRKEVNLEIVSQSAKQKDQTIDTKRNQLTSLYGEQAKALVEIIKLQARLNSGELGADTSSAAERKLKAQQQIYDAIQAQIKGYGELYKVEEQQAVLTEARKKVELDIAESSGKRRDTAREQDQKAKVNELNTLYEKQAKVFSEIIKLRAQLNNEELGDNTKDSIRQKLKDQQETFVAIQKQIKGYGELYNAEQRQKILAEARKKAELEIGSQAAKQKDQTIEAKQNKLNALYDEQAKSLSKIIKLQAQLNSGELGTNATAAIQKKLGAQQKIYDALQKQVESYGELHNIEKQQAVLAEERKRTELDIAENSGRRRDTANVQDQKAKENELDSLYEKQKKTFEEIIRLRAQLNNEETGANTKVAIGAKLKAQQQIFVELNKQIKSYSGLYNAEEHLKQLAEARKKVELEIAQQVGSQKDSKIQKNNTKIANIVDGVQKTYNDMLFSTDQLPIKISDAAIAKLYEYQDLLEQLKIKQQEFKNNPSLFGNKAKTDEFDNLLRQLNVIEGKFNDLQKASIAFLSKIQDAKDLKTNLTFDPNDMNQMREAMQAFANEVSIGGAKFIEFDNAQKIAFYEINDGAGHIQKLAVAFDQGTNAMGRYVIKTKEVETGFQRLINGIGKKFKDVIQYLVGFGGVYRVFGMIKQGIGYVKEIDSAMTELKKVTDATDETYSKFMKHASEASNRIGTTMSEFIRATSDFARLGYTISEASQLAEAASIYKNVGDNITDIGQASESIISSMKAFGLEANDAMNIVSKFNEVGNNFAIDSSGIGDALQKSASALAAAGNTIDESIGLITTANAVVQDPDSVGTALKTLSLRLRGAKADLEDAGLETDNMCESVSTLRERLLALTGNKVDIMLDENTFKSSTQILREMSEAWASMTDINRAAALELMGGKRQANILAAIISNFDMVEDVINTSMNSQGSALRENEVYLNSIQGKIDQFNNSVQTMWANFIDSDSVKAFVELGTQFVKFLNWLGAGKTLISGIAIYLGLIKKMNFVETLKKVPAMLDSFRGKGKNKINLLEGEDLTNEIDKMNSALKAGPDAWNAYKASVKDANNGMYQYAQQVEQAAAADSNARASSEGYTAALQGQSSMAQQAAMKQLLLNAAITAGIIVVSMVVSAIIEYVQSIKSLKEKWEDLQISISDAEHELDSINSRLKETQAQIDALSGKTLSFVEQEELNRLQAQTEELNRQKDIQETILAARKKQNNVTSLAMLQNTLNTTAAGQKEAAASGKAWGKGVGATIGAGIAAAVLYALTPFTGGLSTAAAGAITMGIAGAGIYGGQAAGGWIGEKAGSNSKKSDGTFIGWYETYVEAIKKAEKEASKAETEYINDITDKNYEKWQKKEEAVATLQSTMYDHIAEMQQYVANTEYTEETKDTLDQLNLLLDKVAIDNNGKNAKSNFLNRIFGENASATIKKAKEEINAIVNDTSKTIEEKTVAINDILNSSGSEFEYLKGQIKDVGMGMAEVVDYFTKVGEFSVTSATFSLKDYLSENGDAIDKVQENISAYKSALDSLEGGTFTFSDFIDLIQQFPELAEGVDTSTDSFEGLAKNLKKSIKNSPKALIKDLKKLREELKAAGKSTDAIDQMINSIENLPDESVDNLAKHFGTLADQIDRATQAQNKLADALDDDTNGGYKTRAEAIEKMKELFKVGAIGSESNLWNIAKEFFGDDPYAISVIADKNADSLWALVQAREKWYKLGDDKEYTYDGIESFIKYVAGQTDVLEKFGATWTYSNGVLNFDLDNEQWEEFAHALGLSSQEFSDLMVQIGQFFNIDWANVTDIQKEFDDAINGAETTKEKIDALSDAFYKYGLNIEDIDKLTTEDLLKLDFVQTEAEANELLRVLKDFGNEYKIWKEHLEKDPLDLNVVNKEAVQKQIDELANLYNSLVNGNVDYSKRPLISPEKMIAAGWKNFDGEIATTYSSTYTIGDSNGKEYYINVTPILEDGTILSPEALDDYVNNTLNGDNILGSDSKKLVINVATSLEEDDALQKKLSDIKNDHWDLVKSLNTNVDYVIKRLKDAGLQINETVDTLGNKKITFEIEDLTDLLARNNYDPTIIQEVFRALGTDSSVQEFANSVKSNLQSIKGITDETIQTLDSLGIKYEEVKNNSDARIGINVDETSLANVLALIGSTDAEIQAFKDKWASEGITVKANVDDASVSSANADVEKGTPDQNVAIVAKVDKPSLNSSEKELNNLARDRYQTTYSKVVVEDDKKLTNFNSSSNTQSNRGGIFSGIFGAVANGNAHFDGSAFASGTIGALKTETALTGELGPELRVRDGRWTLLGENGAEFADIQKGDIIFNHKQTQSLLKNGYVTSRGKAYASGTAYASGGGVHKVYSSSSSSNAKGNSSGDKSTDDSKQSIDFIEYKIQEIENIISKATAKIENFLDDTTDTLKKNSQYNTLVDAEKGKAQTYLDAANLYTQKANDLLTKIPQEYRELAKNGAIAIYDFIGENESANAEAIEEYREWAQKADEAENSYLESIAQISAYRLEQLQDIADDFENVIGLVESRSDMIQSGMDLITESGERLSAQYYKELIKNTQEKTTKLQKEKQELQAILDEAVRTGEVQVGSDNWYEMVNAISDVDASILECNIDIEKFQNSINDLKWDNLEKFIKELDNVDSQISHLYGLLSDDNKVVDDMGNWTNEGITSLGLLAQQMELAQYKSEQYGKAIVDLKKDYAAGAYSEDEYNEKLAELTENQWDSIEAYENAKDAIVSLNKVRVDAIKNAMQKEIDAYKELIDAKKESLQADKDAHDFEKQVAEKQKDIAKIQKQLTALANDNSAAAMAKKKQLQAELLDAQNELEEIYYDHSIETQQDALDKEYENYEKNKQDQMEALDEWLKNTDQVVSESLVMVQTQVQTVLATILDTAKTYGVDISDTITSPWENGSNAISRFQGTFKTSTDEFIVQLNKIKEVQDSLATNADSVAQRMIDSFIRAQQEIQKASQQINTIPTSPSTSGTIGSVGTPSSGSSSGGSSSGGSSSSNSGNSGAQPRESVKALQRYLGIKDDGLYGPETKSAVKSLQAKYGVTQDGAYGPQTRAAIIAYYDNQIAKIKKNATNGSSIFGQSIKLLEDKKKAVPPAVYAKGTLGTKKNELAIIDELGEELVLNAGPDGRLQYLTKGTSVIPADLTERLMDIALDPRSVLNASRPNIGAPHLTNNNINIDMNIAEVVHIDTVSNDTLPNLTKTIEIQMESYMKKLNNKLYGKVR